jgi:acyl-homoserine-lactone acylase
MVLGNPHLPWTGDARLYQIQLTIPGKLNVSGAGLYGVPAIMIGHTGHVAWTLTPPTPSVARSTR